MKIIGQPNLFRRRVLSRIDVFGHEMSLCGCCFPSRTRVKLSSSVIDLPDRRARAAAHDPPALPRSPLLEQPPSLSLIALPPWAPGPGGVLGGGAAVSEPSPTQGLCELRGEARKLQKLSHCPEKLRASRASRAWAGLYPISRHIQARPFPTAGLTCPSQGGSQELTCPSGACQSPSPWGTEELGDKERHVGTMRPTLFMQMRKRRPTAWELDARSRLRVASPDAVLWPCRELTRNSLVIESNEKHKHSGGSVSQTLMFCPPPA